MARTSKIILNRAASSLHVTSSQITASVEIFAIVSEVVGVAIAIVGVFRIHAVSVGSTGLTCTVEVTVIIVFAVLTVMIRGCAGTSIIVFITNACCSILTRSKMTLIGEFTIGSVETCLTIALVTCINWLASTTVQTDVRVVVTEMGKVT